MKLRTASPAYIEQAMALSQEEAERLMARMRGKLARRLGKADLQSLEAVALQLQLEDEELQEWRKRWAEIVDRASKQGKKSEAKH
jgi:hypothetical protein